MLEGSWSWISAAFLFFSSLLFSFISFLASSCFASVRFSFHCLFLLHFQGLVMALDVACSWSAISGRMSKPSPPIQAGMAKSSRSMSLMLLLPVIARMTLCLIVQGQIQGCSQGFQKLVRLSLARISDYQSYR